MKPYPLQWPKEKPRTPIGERRRSVFGKAALQWDRVLRDLDHEVERLGGTNLVISTNQQMTTYGKPRAENATVLDPGVAVYFDLEGMPVRFACDQWQTVRENIRAITLHLEAMRGQERWGVGTKRQAFSGYTGLMRTTAEDWRLVLGFSQYAKVTRQDIEEAFRERAKDAHPDKNPQGSSEAMARLNQARNDALKELRD